MRIKYLFILFFIPLAFALTLKPGERINTSLHNITNATYPCIMLDNESVFLSANIAPGSYQCNITGTGYYEEIVISTGGGGSRSRYISKGVINKPIVLNNTLSTKPYWLGMEEEPKEVTKEIIKEIPKEEIKEEPKQVPKEIIKEAPKEIKKNNPIWAGIIIMAIVLIIAIVTILLTRKDNMM